MYVPRILASHLARSNKSVLLLGPRQTGKSTLIREYLKPNLCINLADEQTYLDFARNPTELQSRLSAKKYQTVFLDEVQRLPALMNTLQVILDGSSPAHFYMTGSSARKLKRGKANLLPGRIHVYHLGPLCCAELGYHMDTTQALETGTLPGIYTEQDTTERTKTLRSYASTYLKEEIQAEALTRNLEGFSRLIFMAAQWSGHFLDMNKLATESQIARQTAMSYFEILEDTLIVQRCPSFSQSHRKRLIKHPKFYFFDTGVLNALLGNFQSSADRKGLLFEHLVFNQIQASAMATDIEIQISSYRTEHGAAVDLIVELSGQVWAIECKASNTIHPGDLRGLKNFADFYGKRCHLAVAYLGNIEKKVDGISVLPWQMLLQEMGL